MKTKNSAAMLTMFVMINAMHFLQRIWMNTEISAIWNLKVVWDGFVHLKLGNNFLHVPLKIFSVEVYGKTIVNCLYGTIAGKVGTSFMVGMFRNLRTLFVYRVQGICRGPLRVRLQLGYWIL